MSKLEHLFEGNLKWAESIKKSDPDFFNKLSKQQKPEYLWIGCSDSRVPANQIVDLLPGEIFVHRNVANLVVHSDINCLSVIQYAVELLKVKHIIVCGHYGCGGVKAAMDNIELGVIDNWIRYIKDIYKNYSSKINTLNDEKSKFDLLCELNVKEQVLNVCKTSFVQKAWKNNNDLTVHGWIYSIEDGLLRDLNVNISSLEEFEKFYK